MINTLPIEMHGKEDRFAERGWVLVSGREVKAGLMKRTQGRGVRKP